MVGIELTATVADRTEPDDLMGTGQGYHYGSEWRQKGNECYFKMLSRAALVTQMIEERVNLAFKFNSHA